MKRINFETGTVTGNILNAALPMLVAQLLSLLYNIVDRIYIGRIPEIGTAALGAVGKALSGSGADIVAVCGDRVTAAPCGHECEAGRELIGCLT